MAAAGKHKELQVVCKYAADRAIGLVGLLGCLPIFAAVAALIRLEDGGPVFFRHERPGLDGRPFRVWKFRTMVVGADRLLDARGGAGSRRRVTRVGAILRKTSVDELPQLLNLLDGIMSLVGPRPPVPEHVARYTPEQRRRFRMKPGITGLAQVSGRNRLPWSRRIELDNRYIDDYSWGLDLAILVRTVRMVLLREGISLDRNPEEVDDLGPPRGEPSATTARS
jgi:lipopolysaccharide/colanic/teichoic acid biosynthesis glycosyltransferase